MMKLVKTGGLLFFCLLLWGQSIPPARAQTEASPEETVKVRITKVEEVPCTETAVQDPCQNIRVLALDGPIKGRFFTIELTPTDASLAQTKSTYAVGETYYATYIAKTETGKEDLSLGEIDRTGGLLLLLALFVVLVLLFARKQGAYSLLALVLNFAIVIFVFAQGMFWHVPVLALALLGGIPMMFLALFLSHGFNRKSLAAFLGSLTGLGFTILLTFVFMSLTRLTGFASEEAVYLTGGWDSAPVWDILFLGILIGMMGVLDDVTIGQASTAFQIAAANPELGVKEVYRHTISVGKDHVASLVNTLIIAYAGASFPLFLLLLKDSGDLWSTVNAEVIAEEIVRMLVGSIGLILTIPVTTWIASRLATAQRKNGAS